MAKKKKLNKKRVAFTIASSLAVCVAAVVVAPIAVAKATKSIEKNNEN